MLILAELNQIAIKNHMQKKPSLMNIGELQVVDGMFLAAGTTMQLTTYDDETMGMVSRN